MSWDKILTDGTTISDLYEKRTSKSGMTKQAGLFMRPSEIGNHENLTHALEAKLNGASPEPQFKLARSTRSTAGGAAIGAVGGFTAHHKAKNREVRELAPEEVKGVRGKVRKAINSAQRAQTEFANKSPKTSMAVHTSAGAVAGGVVGGPAAKTINRALRRR